MKHKIKNIANRAIPVDGTNLKPEPGKIVKAEITPKLEKMIKDGFFEDLGAIEEKKKAKEDMKAKVGIPDSIKDDGINTNKTPYKESKKKKKRKKKKKKEKSFFSEE